MNGKNIQNKGNSIKNFLLHKWETPVLKMIRAIEFEVLHNESETRLPKWFLQPITERSLSGKLIFIQ